MELENLEAVNGAIKDLTEVQANSVLSFLSKAIGIKTNEIHSSYDDDFFEATGKRKGNQRSYEFFKSEFAELKNLKEQVKEIDTLKTENEALKGKGGSESEFKTKIASLEQQLTDSNLLVEQHKAKFVEKEAELKTKTSEFASIASTSAFNTVLGGLNLAKDKDENLVNSFIQGKRNEFLKYTTDTVDGQAVYRDAKGEIVRDKQLNFLDAKGIVSNMLDPVVTKKEAAAGSGGTGSTNQGQRPLVTDLTIAKTKGEAYDMAKKAVFATGITKLHKDYLPAYDKIIEENKEYIDTLN